MFCDGNIIYNYATTAAESIIKEKGTGFTIALNACDEFFLIVCSNLESIWVLTHYLDSPCLLLHA